MIFLPAHHVVCIRFIYQKQQLDFHELVRASKIQGRNVARDRELLKLKDDLYFLAGLIHRLDAAGKVFQALSHDQGPCSAVELWVQCKRIESELHFKPVPPGFMRSTP